MLVISGFCFWYVVMYVEDVNEELMCLVGVFFIDNCVWGCSEVICVEVEFFFG